MLEDAQPRQVLTVAESAGALPAGTACLRLDDPAVQARLAASSGANPGQAERMQPLVPGASRVRYLYLRLHR